MGNASSRWRAAGCLAFAALLAAAPTPTYAQTPTPQQIPRLLDPLTQAERDLAVRLVTADQRVRGFAGRRRTETAYVELLVQKPPQESERPTRRAEVLVTAIGGEPGGLRAIVDLSRQTVVEVLPAVAVRPPFMEPGGGQQTVPISAREVEFARGLVIRDAGFRQMLSAPPDGVRRDAIRPEEITTEVLPIITPEELCPSGRCVEILFRRGRGYLTTRAVVELSTGTVRYRGRRQ